MKLKLLQNLLPAWRQFWPATCWVCCVGLMVSLPLIQPAVGQTTLYKAGSVHTMAGKIYSPGQVLVVDGKIQSVGKSVKAANAKVVDLGEDSVIIPGLVDAYSQLGLATSSTDEYTREVTPEFRTGNGIDWSKSALRRQLEAGTTTMNLCPGTQNVIGGIASIVKTAAVPEKVINDDGALVATVCSDPASRNRSRARPDSIYVRQPTNRMGVVWILRNTFNKAKSAKPDSKLANVKQVLDKKRPLMVVSRMSYDLNTVGTLADEFGFDPVIVGGQEAYKIKSIMADRKYPVILEPQAPGVLSGTERSELCWNNAGILDEAGIPFALSGNDLLAQAQFACRYGLDKEKALQAITIAPAKILGIDNRVGSIESGKDADLIVLNGDPLEITTSIRWVMVNGKIIEKKKDQ